MAGTRRLAVLVLGLPAVPPNLAAHGVNRMHRPSWYRRDGTPFPGLYAAGEVAGFGGGGVHGYNALEGTFLGGCIFSGRAAGYCVSGAARRHPGRELSPQSGIERSADGAT